MTRDRMEELFARATVRALDAARRNVWNEIPDTVCYNVYLNQSYDLDPDGQSRTTYPEERLPPGQYRGPLTSAEAVELLWRDGRVPEWIDVTVWEVVEGVTYIQLDCCGRFTDDEARTYYDTWGMGPFGVKGPALPWWWKPDAPPERFDLHWRHKVDDETDA